MIVISNATPLITLAKIRQFDLLEKLLTEIVISDEVWNEVVVSGAGRSDSDETAKAGWIRVVSLMDSTLLSFAIRAKPFALRRPALHSAIPNPQFCTSRIPFALRSLLFAARNSSRKTALWRQI